VFSRISGAGTVAARLPTRHRHWRRVNENNRATRGSVTASSPLPFPAGGDMQNKPKTQQAVDFSFFLFRVPGSVCFPFWICFVLVSPSSLLRCSLLVAG